jgi:hypothetical protein
VSDIKYTPGAPTLDALLRDYSASVTVKTPLGCWDTVIIVTCTPAARDAAERWAEGSRAKGVEVEVVVVGESAP